GNEAITGPVQVLQHQDHWTGRGTGVNETRPGQLQLPVDGRWPESVERVPWDGDPRSYCEGKDSMVNRPLISRYPLKRGLDFLPQPVARRRRGLIERDLALAPKQFAECPVREAVTGRRAASLKDGRLRMASRRQVEELPDQAALPDAGRSGDQ